MNSPDNDGRRTRRWPAARSPTSATPPTTADAANNPVVADLLRAHQAGDTDATTVLLCAFIPYVCRDPALTVGPDRIADRWAALGRLLAITDPSCGDRPDEHRSFLLVLVGRMRRHATRLRYSPDRRVAASLSPTA